MNHLKRETPPGYRDGSWNGVDGFTPKLRIWVCFYCGRSASCPVLYYCTPNTMCGCQMPRFMVKMTEVTEP